MLSNKGTSGKDNNGSRLLAIIVGYVVFCGLSQLSRVVYPFFGLVVLIGIALPLVWGRFTGEWSLMGFSRRNLGEALLWGIGAGVVSSIVGLLILEEQLAASNLLQQLLIGVPLWLLVISPFQEFFFRGWMQSGLGKVLGEWRGLIIANVCFTLWHYVSPIADAAPMPLGTVLGVGSTFVAGLAYGYGFMKSKSMVAPWLGHAISGIVFVMVGAMDFIQAMR
jgi:membrane protease YdiL (CAAX protease family)